MMDIEKLIEQLRYLADTPSYTAFHNVKEREIICDQCEADFCHDKLQDAHWCMYEALSRAATALSTLQAENDKLRAELEYEKEHANAYYEECGKWEAENIQLKEKLEALKQDMDAIEQDFRAFAKQWWEEDIGFPCRWCKFERSGRCEQRKEHPEETICGGRWFEWRGQKED